MAAQADRLLVHGHLIRKDGGLGENPALVDLGIFQNFLHPLAELFPIRGNRFRRTNLHLFHQRGDGGGLGPDILRQLLALPFPHGVEALQRLGEHLEQVRGNHIGIPLLLLHQKHIREPGEERD